jgi:nucleoside-diphosphate-sugar epimerase
MSKNILVTGGAGFIGSHICELLLSKQSVGKIRVLDNLSTGKLSNIQHILDKLEFIKGDICDINVCEKAIDGMDIICHQAAIASVPYSIDNPLSSHEHNINGTLNLLVVAKKKGIKRFVYASSSSIYGDNHKLPKTELMSPKLLSPYALNKRVTEMYASLFTKIYDIDCIGLRYFNVYGPRQDPNGAYPAVIPKFIDSIVNNKSPTIFGDGNASRDFVYVTDVANANWLAMTTRNKCCYGIAMNVGSGIPTTLNFLVKTINKEANKNIEAIYGPIRAGDIPHSLADISKTSKILRFNSKIILRNGIKTLVEQELGVFN